MFDIEALTDGAMKKVEETIRRCREGGYTGDRGSKTRAILLGEAEVIVSRYLRDAFTFDPEDFPAYAKAFPSILTTHVGPGELADLIGGAVKRQIQRGISEQLMEAILAQRSDEDLGSLLAEIESRVTDTLDPIRQFHGHRLRSAIEDCRDEPDNANLRQLADELRRQAVEMQTVIHNLDIADPPSADYAGRGRRMLLESADVIDLVLKLGRSDEFRLGMEAAAAVP